MAMKRICVILILALLLAKSQVASLTFLFKGRKKGSQVKVNQIQTKIFDSTGRIQHVHVWDARTGKKAWTRLDGNSYKDKHFDHLDPHELHTAAATSARASKGIQFATHMNSKGWTAQKEYVLSDGTRDLEFLKKGGSSEAPANLVRPGRLAWRPPRPPKKP